MDSMLNTRNMAQYWEQWMKQTMVVNFHPVPIKCSSPVQFSYIISCWLEF